MPYLPLEAKRDIDNGTPPVTPGELNYKLTDVALDYLNRIPVNYHVLNDIMGAFESAKLEFYRRVVVPYEERKRQENGDVYS